MSFPACNFLDLPWFWPLCLHHPGTLHVDAVVPHSLSQPGLTPILFQLHFSPTKFTFLPSPPIPTFTFIDLLSLNSTFSWTHSIMTSPTTICNVCTRVGPNSEYGLNTEYRIIQFLKILRIIWFLKMNEYRISNSTIQSQLFEYRILKIE